MVGSAGVCCVCLSSGCICRCVWCVLKQWLDLQVCVVCACIVWATCVLKVRLGYMQCMYVYVYVYVCVSVLYMYVCVCFST